MAGDCGAKVNHLLYIANCAERRMKKSGYGEGQTLGCCLLLPLLEG